MYIDKIDYNAQPRLVQLMLDVRQAGVRIIRLRENVNRINAQLCKCTSRLTGLPRGSQSISWDELINQKDDLEAEIKRVRTEQMRLSQLVATSPDCDRLELDEYHVLCERYMTGHSLAETAMELRMGKTTVYETEQRALAKIRTNPNESERSRTI